MHGVDLQVHIWSADTPDRPWPPGRAQEAQKPYPMASEAQDTPRGLLEKAHSAILTSTGVHTHWHGAGGGPPPRAGSGGPETPSPTESLAPRPG